MGICHPRGRKTIIALKAVEEERDDKNKALLHAQANEKKERAAREELRRSLYTASMSLIPNV